MEKEVLRWLAVADRYKRMYLDKQLAPLGINSSQHMYVLKVCAEPGITQDQFLQSFYVHPSNVTRAVAALEKGGFLRRETCEARLRTGRVRQQWRQIRYCNRLPSRPCFLKVTSASPCCQPRPISSLPQYWHR